MKIISIIYFGIPIYFIIGFYIFGKIQKINIEKENKLYCQKFIKNLPNTKIFNLIKSIKNIPCFETERLYLESDNYFSFFTLEDAQKKESEINSEQGYVAFIHAAQTSRYSSGWKKFYIVFKISLK